MGEKSQRRTWDVYLCAGCFGGDINSHPSRIVSLDIRCSRCSKLADVRVTVTRRPPPKPKPGDI
jgi:hypothetical protein